MNPTEALIYANTAAALVLGLAQAHHCRKHRRMGNHRRHEP